MMGAKITSITTIRLNTTMHGCIDFDSRALKPYHSIMNVLETATKRSSLDAAWRGAADT